MKGGENVTYEMSEEKRDHYIHCETRYELIKHYIDELGPDEEPDLFYLRLLVKEYDNGPEGTGNPA